MSAAVNGYESDENDGGLVGGPQYGSAAPHDQHAPLPDVQLDEDALTGGEEVAAENAAALEQLPESVKKFVVQLHTALSAGNLAAVTTLYERTYGQLTNEFFKTEEWPRAEVVAPLVRNDEVFLTFYRELYFRHLYSRFSQNIDIEDRFDSYDNYCNFFNYVLNSEGPVNVELPVQWIWDIIDEFIWQFGSYSAWRSKTRDKNDDEIEMLQESPQVWSSYSVLNVLYSLIQKSKISEQLRALTRGEEMDSVKDEFGARPLYRMLGYFSILGLLRVHVLLGDYTLALKVMDDIDVRTMAQPATRLHAVHAAHVSAYFYIGFASLMMQRYGDAIDWLSKGVSHYHKHRRFTSGAEQIGKQVDRMLGLIAVAHALLPSHRLEDWVKQGITDKFAEQHAKMQRGPWTEAAPIIEELWLRACPKFVSPTPPPFQPADPAPGEEAIPAGSELDATRHQLGIFLETARVRIDVVPDMRSLLKLYTTLSTDKLAGLTSSGGGGGKASEGDALCELAIVKGAMRDTRWHEGSLIEGENEIVGDLGFGIEKSIVTISETRRPRQFADYFLRKSLRTAEALETLRSKPLPAARGLTSVQAPAQRPRTDPAGTGKELRWASPATS